MQCQLYGFFPLSLKTSSNISQPLLAELTSLVNALMWDLASKWTQEAVVSPRGISVLLLARPEARAKETNAVGGGGVVHTAGASSSKSLALAPGCRRLSQRTGKMPTWGFRRAVAGT